MMLPNPNDILEGDFWPEPVRVLTVQPLGTRTRIDAVGTKTQSYHPSVLISF